MDTIQDRKIHDVRIQQFIKAPQGLFIMSQVIKSLKDIESVMSNMNPLDKNLIVDHITKVWANKIRK
jgi:hypothetical protein